jgi:uncharacterized HAD superfamily protein/hypoxanthine phosphoribosyltransferase
MQFRSISDLASDVAANLHRLPQDIDIVVGIPRSGMLVASMIALARNLPLTDLESFSAERPFARGTSRLVKGEVATPRNFSHALIVDDSSNTGAAMKLARRQLTHLPFNARQTFAVAYGSAESKGLADIVFAEVKTPRVFEWNVLHHPFISSACVDIDGVLCLDPDHQQNDDGEAYLAFLQQATPLHKPRREIHTLVTNRLEKYRAQTEDWLERNGIVYRRLEMLDLPDQEARRRMRPYAGFKASVYRGCDARLFIESEASQAREIARLSGKPVLSLEGPMMYRPGAFQPSAIRQQLVSGQFVKALARRVLGDQLYRALSARRARLDT